MALFQKIRTFNILSRETPMEKGLFLKRMGLLLEEGYSLKDALEFLIKIEKGSQNEWTQIIQKGLLTGSSLHHELQGVGFSEKICAQIYLATQYGNYGQTIRQCGEQLIENNKRQSKLKSLVSYPILLVLFLIVMLFVMRFLIFPHMEMLLLGLNSNQTIYQNSMIRFIYYSPHILVVIFILGVIIFQLFRFYLNQQPFMRRVALYMQIPFLNSFLKDYYSQFFFFEWGQLFQNGCSFQEIIQIMQGKGASNLLRETGFFLSQEMLSGKTIHEAISCLPYFYEEGLLVISHGENIGRLGVEMLVYADFCETQLNNRLEKLMEKIQPIIFSLVGLMIVAIYAALMLPIFMMMEGF